MKFLKFEIMPKNKIKPLVLLFLLFKQIKNYLFFLLIKHSYSLYILLDNIFYTFLRRANKKKDIQFFSIKNLLPKTLIVEKIILIT